jgi:hypothetical protein
MRRCKYCGRPWRNMQALRAHLRFCEARKIHFDQWERFRVTDGSRSANVCIISRSPKTIRALREQHRLLASGAMEPSIFLGIVSGLELVGHLKSKLEVL